MYSIQKRDQNSFLQTPKDLLSVRTRFKLCSPRGGQRATGGSPGEADGSSVLSMNTQQVKPPDLNAERPTVPGLLFHVHITGRTQAQLGRAALTLLTCFCPAL